MNTDKELDNSNNQSSDKNGPLPKNVEYVGGDVTICESFDQVQAIFAA
jgi:hypothetical protein